MKCIDAIEGNVKYILKELHSTCIQNNLDDSEYILNVKTVIDATDQYIQNNPEIVKDPKLLKQVLYVYSRNLWLIGQPSAASDPQSEIEDFSVENEEYQTYYYDYLYHRGVYPS